MNKELNTTKFVKGYILSLNLKDYIASEKIIFKYLEFYFCRAGMARYRCPVFRPFIRPSVCSVVCPSIFASTKLETITLLSSSADL